MYNGLEIDVMSLGDADSILITQWGAFGSFHVLVDGGSKSNAEEVKEFLLRRNASHLYAIVCSHPHNDHASGLIELLKDGTITCTGAWLHDIRNHVNPEALRRARSGNSAQAEAVRQVVETTSELASAFARRGLIPQEPFAGASIAAWPWLKVLGPSLDYYRITLNEFIEESARDSEPPILGRLGRSASTLEPGFSGSLHRALLGTQPNMASRLSFLSGIAPPPTSLGAFSARSGLLQRSAVKERPVTQPFNNTSVILGGLAGSDRLLFTADAGAEALSRIHPGWKDLTWLQAPHHGSDGNLSRELIERFRPVVANISARGDESHPSRAIVSGLVKAGAQVFSTHLAEPGHLWFRIGAVPPRPEYGPAIPMRGTGAPRPVVPWARLGSGGR